MTTKAIKAHPVGGIGWSAEVVQLGMDGFTQETIHRTRIYGSEQDAIQIAYDWIVGNCEPRA